MLREFLKCVSIPQYIIFYTLLFVVSCKTDRKEVNVSQVDINIHAQRLENDLAENSDNLSLLKEKYGSFFDLYTYQLLQVGTTDTVLLKSRLQDFIHDPDISNISADVKKMYGDFTSTDAQLTDAFRHYKYYFPAKPVPAVVTYISGFNYAIVSADSTLGIGLDMYLGSDSKYYPSLQMPVYKTRKMRKEYIAADAMRGWAQSEWEQDQSQTDLLSQMVYLGKIQYFIDQLLPDAPDTVTFGFTNAQLQWCEMSEKSIWSFFVDQKLLFSNEASQIGKFVNDGPSTNGFPKEAPGNIGAWIGYRIVKAYMDKNESITLSKLMDEKDPKKIFRESNYKPAK
jgi:gliding motility-associated lipoprotein GldB